MHKINLHMRKSEKQVLLENYIFTVAFSWKLTFMKITDNFAVILST